MTTQTDKQLAKLQSENELLKKQVKDLYRIVGVLEKHLRSTRAKQQTTDYNVSALSRILNKIRGS